jgi:hypothetical protein
MAPIVDNSLGLLENFKMFKLSEILVRLLACTHTGEHNTGTTGILQ